MSKKANKTASVLAFERKLDPSDALMYSGNWEDRDNDGGWSPIAIREKSVRGTISNRLKSSDQTAIKVDAAIQNPNLQTVRSEERRVGKELSTQYKNMLLLDKMNTIEM